MEPSEKPRTIVISFSSEGDRYPQADDFLRSVSMTNRKSRTGACYHIVSSREVLPKNAVKALSTRRFRLSVLRTTHEVVGRSSDDQRLFTFSWNGRGRR